VAQIDVRTETETAHGWRYDVAITREPAGESAAPGPSVALRATRHTVTLSWADHQFWSGGAQAPSRTIETVLAFLMDREEDPGDAFILPDRFDAATARRWFPSLDAHLGVPMERAIPDDDSRHDS